MEGIKCSDMKNNKSSEDPLNYTPEDTNKTQQVIELQENMVVTNKQGDVEESVTENTKDDCPKEEEKKDATKADVINITNTSLCNLLVYSSGDSSSSSSSSSSDSESDSDDSGSSSSSGVEEVINKPQAETSSSANAKSKKKALSLLETLKNLGELSIDDLPPVPDVSTLSINVEDCEVMGKVASIVDKLVMVESIPNMPAYDIDTLLFINNGKQPLGYIFDVIGAVTCPMYAIRFNSIEEIKSLNVSKGLPVYSAPKSEHTQYVFVQQLMQAKGSDASWSNDLEVPHEFEDYSDDEAETRKNSFRGENRKRNSLERYKNFEKDMNVKNIIDSRLHKIRDNTEPTNKKQTPNNNYKRPQQHYQQNNYWPNVGYSQANVSAPSCAFPYTMPPYMQPFRPQGLPQFVPSNMPPANFGQRHPVPNVYPMPNVPFPAPDLANAMFAMPPPPPSGPQAKTTQPNMVYHPPDMGLPRPPVQPSATYVPNMPFFDPRMSQVFPSMPQANRPPFPQPNFYPKRP